jgi:putative FmdB family regulatory protein
MPIYEYDCRACGHHFDALVRKGDVPACPECKSTDLERLLSAFAVSSEERSLANVQAARKIAEKTTWRDQKYADAEAIRKHEEEHN